MDEMIRYIFNGLHHSEYTLNSIKKFLKKQSKINKLIWISSIITIVNLIGVERTIREFDKKIHDLEDKMEKQEGEY